MRVRLAFNATSGYGKSALLADLFAGQLVADGHQVDRRPAGRGFDETFRCLEQDDLLILVGGDGTVHHALPPVIAARVPVYHVPTGTENLFARDWGMDRRIETLREAIAAWRVVRADLGSCDAKPFALMCSVGLDAAIIHARCRAIGKRDGHLGYFIPVIEQLADPVLPPLRITVDDQRVVDGARGLAMVANSRQYAMRLNPALRANNTDGLLDLVFLPCATPLGAACWSVLARVRGHGGAPGAVYLTGRHILIETIDGPAPWQIDGEPLGIWDGADRGSTVGASLEATSRHDFAVSAGALLVLDARIPRAQDQPGSAALHNQRKPQS